MLAHNNHLYTLFWEQVDSETSFRNFCSVWRPLITHQIFSIRKLRSASHGQLLINLCCSLVGLYVTFVVAIYATGHTGVCVVVAALLQYFFLVTFMIMTAEAIHLYLKLVIVLGKMINYYVLKASVTAWSMLHHHLIYLWAFL